MSKINKQTKSLIALIVALLGVLLALICLLTPFFTYSLDIPIRKPSTVKQTGIAVISDAFSQGEDDLLENLTTIKDLYNLDIDVNQIKVGFIFIIVGALGVLFFNIIIAVLLGLSTLLRKKPLFIAGHALAFVNFVLSVLSIVGVALLIANLNFSFGITTLLTVTSTATFGASSILFFVGTATCCVSLFFVDFSTLDVIGNDKKLQTTDDTSETSSKTQQTAQGDQQVNNSQPDEHRNEENSEEER